MVISVIEESFFRVLLFGKLKERSTPILAAVIASFIYAVLHFVSPDKSFNYQAGGMFVGFEYLGVVLTGLLQIQIVFGIVGLFMVGLTLCYALQKTSSIYLCIGLHSGWVVAVKMLGVMTRFNPPYDALHGAIRRNFLVSNYESWASVLLVFFLLFIFCKLRKS